MLWITAFYLDLNLSLSDAKQVFSLFLCWSQYLQRQHGPLSIFDGTIHNAPDSENLFLWIESKTRSLLCEIQPTVLLIQKHLSNSVGLLWWPLNFCYVILSRFTIHWCKFRHKTRESSSSNTANHPMSCFVNFLSCRGEFF